MKIKKFFFIDIFIVIFFILITSIFIIDPSLNTTPVRTILGLPMVLFFPGYSLIAALFPRQDDLDGIERFALSLGLSIAVVPLFGLALNYTQWGIRLNPILITLDIFILLMCLITIKRRSVLPDQEVFRVPFKAFYRSLHTEIFDTNRSTIDKILTVILVIAILVSIIMVVYVIVIPKQGEKFTEFYILGPGGMADDYPTAIMYGETGTVKVGIVNHEYETVNYTLELRLDGENIVLSDYWNAISLAHNQTMERNLTFLPNKLGTDMKLEFLLYKENNKTAPYRDLHLWIDVSEMNVPEMNVPEMNVSEMNVSEMNVSEINVSEMNVSEINESSPIGQNNYSNG
jgi:uncharacterized membrane protein